MIKDGWPLPRTLLDFCGSGCFLVFSTMDLADGFWQIPLSPESQKYTCFSAHLCLFVWLVSPMGLTNSPAAFCRYLETIFGFLYLVDLLPYVDDLNVMSPSVDDHLFFLRRFF